MAVLIGNSSIMSCSNLLKKLDTIPYAYTSKRLVTLVRTLQTSKNEKNSGFSLADYDMMARAIKIAKWGRFTTSPNPNVGCLITQSGNVVGEGFHRRAGDPHAEVHALIMAGKNARGGAAYVTLEPCSHQGRTPSCAKALVDAGISKVFCAMQDPNPKVCGRGLSIIEEAGVRVEVGLLREEARYLNRTFLKKMETRKPFVQLKMAASLDGRTALHNGESKWITSASARQDVQYFRSQADVILSTSQTVVMDNASLNVRWNDLPDFARTQYPEQQLRQPKRVILDRGHRLTEELDLYRSEGDVLRVAPQDADILVPADDEGCLDLHDLIRKLGSDHDINHIWVEAGATLSSSILKAQLADELVVYLAPKIIGGDGQGLISALGLTSVSCALELDLTDIRMVGSDLRIISKPKY